MLFRLIFTSGCDLLVIAVIYAVSGSKLTYLNLGQHDDSHAEHDIRLIMNLMKIRVYGYSYSITICCVTLPSAGHMV